MFYKNEMDIYKEFKLLSTKFQPNTFNLGSLVRNDASSLTALRVVQAKILLLLILRIHCGSMRFCYELTHSQTRWLIG